MFSKKLHLTAFDKAVYEAVLLIPIGQTRSYGWVAKKAGYAKSSRAVGNSLHKNPFAPFIPCHRVILSNGSLGGYRFGAKKKRELLQREKDMIGGSI